MPQSELNANAELRAQILAAAERGDASATEDLWLELIETPPQDLEFYESLIQRFKDSGSLEAGHGLMVLLCEELVKREDWELLHGIARMFAPVWAGSAELRPFVAKAIKGQHAGNPDLGAILASCKGLPIDQVFKKFDTCVKLARGEVYKHAYWGEGIVRKTDFAGGKITLDFPTEQGKTIPVDFLNKHLKHLSPDSFLALRATKPEVLRALADEEPMKLLKLVLAGNGNSIQQSELKALLLDVIIAESAWSAWWTRARAAMRLDPMIHFDAGRGAHATIALRDRPKTLEEEIEELFFAPEASLPDRIAAVDQLHKSTTSAPAQLVTHMVGHLDSLFAKQKNRSAVEVAEFAFLRDDLCVANADARRHAASIPETSQAVAKLQDYDLLRDFEDADYAARALKLMVQRDAEEGIAQAAAVLPVGSSKLAQAIWRELDAERHEALQVRALRTLFGRPLENPETYVWAVRSLIEGRWPHLEDHIPISGLIPELVDQVSEWHHIAQRGTDDKRTAAAAKLLVSKMRALLQTRNFAPISAAAENLAADEVQRLLQAIQVSDAFNEAFKSGAERHIILMRHDLQPAYGAGAGGSMVSPGEGLHWCTARAREEKLNEMNHLNSVEIPANAKEIEKARSEGDLKENAGYIFAKEKQKLLMQRSLRLTQDVSTARVFDAARVRTDSIGFGVRFEAQNLSSDQPEAFIMLGRFETDPDKHILSYQSPFGQQFVGKKIGDELQVKHPGGGETPYRVLAISNALASEEWAAHESSREVTPASTDVG